MTKLTYVSVYDLPAAMRDELAAAPTADVAEAIFNKWENECFVEHRSRASVYREA